MKYNCTLCEFSGNASSLSRAKHELQVHAAEKHPPIPAGITINEEAKKRTEAVAGHTQAAAEAAERAKDALPEGFIPIDSSNIKALAFTGMEGEDLLQNPALDQVGRLKVIFKHSGAYEYHSVPKRTVASIIAAQGQKPSAGELFSAMVRNNKSFTCVKLDLTK